MVQKEMPMTPNTEQDRKKSRAGGANTMAYLKERAETEATLKRKESEIKRIERVNAASKGAEGMTRAV